jgi:hypothetical protein
MTALYTGKSRKTPFDGKEKTGGSINPPVSEEKEIPGKDRRRYEKHSTYHRRRFRSENASGYSQAVPECL